MSLVYAWQRTVSKAGQIAVEKGFHMRNKLLVVKLVLVAAIVLLNLGKAYSQSALDTHLQKLLNSVKVTAGMYMPDGTQMAGRSSLMLRPDEVVYIVSGFSNPSALYANGPQVNGVRFMCVRADAERIVLKKGAEGIVCARSTKYIVIAKFNEAEQAPNKVHSAMTSYVDYLKSMGL